MKTSADANGVKNNVNSNKLKIKGIFSCKTLEGVEDIFESGCWFLKYTWSIVFN